MTQFFSLLSRRLARVAATAASLFACSGQHVIAQDLHAITASLTGEVAVTPIEAFGPSDITGGDVLNIELPQVTGEPIVIEVRTATWKTLRLFLTPNVVRAEGYRLITQLADGSYADVEAGPERTYSGTLEGLEGTVVAGSILEEGFFGSIWLPDGTRLWIQPLVDLFPGIGGGLHVVYAGENTRCEGICDTEPLPGTQPRHAAAGRYGPRASCGGQACIAELACDADFEYYTARGSNALAAQDRMAAIINVMNHQYMRDVNITHRITASLVRTAEPDPYTATDRIPLINEVATQWINNHAAITRDLVQLFTGREMDGNIIGRARGIAAVCSSNVNSYSLVQSDFSATFACQTDLSSHELGHLWGAVHCTCSGATMNASITCTNTFVATGSQSVADIDAYAATLNCLTNGVVRPTNDLCSQATAITADGTYLGNNTGATTDGGQINCGSVGAGVNDIWWTWTSPGTGGVTFTTCGSSIDTILSVHTDCPGSLVNSVACNDDVSSLNCPGGTPANRQSSVTFAATTGTKYFIRVAGFNSATGNVQLNLTSFAPPSNDACANPEVLTANLSIGRLYNATNENDVLCDSGITRDIWYTFVAPCNGTLVVSTCGSRDFYGDNTGPDTVLGLFDACGGTALACNDDAVCTVTTGDARDSEISRVLTSGQRVLIRASQFSNTVSSAGNGIVRIRGIFTESFNDLPELTPVPNGTIACGTSYSYQVSLNNQFCAGNVTYSLTAGPPGISTISASGVVSWTPAAPGTYNFTARATNNDGFDTVSWTLTVTPRIPVISTISSYNATCGSTFTSPAPTLTNSVCVGAPVWSLVTGPIGSSIDSSTGVLTFPPTSTGAFTVNIRATNSAGFDDEAYTVNVGSALPIISPIADQSRSCPVGYTGPVASLANAACAGTVTYSLLAGPPGTLINASTGVVSANLSVPGTYSFNIRAANLLGSDTEAWDVVVVPASPNVLTPSDQTLSCPVTYTGPSPVVTNVSCVQPITWQLVQGPPGVTINPSTGSVSWLAPTSGTHVFTVRADTLVVGPSVSWTVFINSAFPNITTQPIDQVVTEGSTAVLSVATTGVPVPFSYQWRRNAIPLVNGGAISGANSPVLTLSPSSLADEGLYDCIITNTCGTRNTRRASLSVNPFCSPCPADYNQDGGVDGADVDTFFADWVNAAPCADANADGGIDGADVDTFFEFWVAGGC